MNSISFELSTNSRHSFPTPPVGCEEPVLIDASVPKLLKMWRVSDQGWNFLESPGGVEKPSKLARVQAWLESSATVWAPVVEWRSHAPEQVELQDGRHTLVALNSLGFRRVQIAVRASTAKHLSELFDLA